jgi:hypothetical protein
MKSFTFMTLAAAAVVVSAHAEPIADRERAAAVQAQAAQQSRIDQAREKCIANRGTDCDSLQGLQEWLLQDRSRADAVLDRVYPPAVPGSASAGASSPMTVSPGTPQLSPKNQP